MIQPFAFMFQEEAKDFITMDNIDERIEEALDNPKNYNFAIDKEGRVVKRTVIQWLIHNLKNKNTYVHKIYTVSDMV